MWHVCISVFLSSSVCSGLNYLKAALSVQQQSPGSALSGHVTVAILLVAQKYFKASRRSCFQDM
jgi:hypothetical protein